MYQVLLISGALAQINQQPYNCNLKIPFGPNSQIYPFTPQDLPYPYDYFTPMFSMEMIYMHHERQLHNYYEQLNEYIDNEGNRYAEQPVIRLLQQAREDQTLRRYAGGIYNHSLMFWSLTNQQCAIQPQGQLQQLIETNWGSYDEFVEALVRTALNFREDGWLFICVSPDIQLLLVTYPREQNPIMRVQQPYCMPILAIDLWEHSYYLEYLYNKESYIRDVAKLLDWRIAEMFLTNYVSIEEPVPVQLFIQMAEAQHWYKLNRRGNVVQQAREVYLRDDIQCGHQQCFNCGLTNLRGDYILIPDLQCLLTNWTVLGLDSDIFGRRNVVLLQTILSTLKDTNRRIYYALYDYIKDFQLFVLMNEHLKDCYVQWNEEDRENKILDKVAIWYKKHLQNVQVKVISETDGPERISLRDFLNQTDLSDKIPFEGQLDSNSTYEQHIDIQEAKALIKQGELYEGVIRFQPNIAEKAWINVRKHVFNPFHITIEGAANLNRAVDGDIVAVQVQLHSMDIDQTELIEEEQSVDVIQVGVQIKQIQQVGVQGKVVCILQRSIKELCGSITPTQDYYQNLQKCIFHPINPRISDIIVYVNNTEAVNQQRVTAFIDYWPQNSQYPIGHFSKIIGPIDDIATESQVILKEHDVIVKPFTQKALDCLPPDDWCITPEEVGKRLDLRDRCVASVDPPGCKDIDDALHCRQLNNGNYEVGVHIADVTHFVKPDCALDIEASLRCNTVYLVERRTDMLPSILTERLCSLVGGEERLAFSVLWEIDQNSNVVDVKFCKSVIQSRAALSYGVAQGIIDSDDQSELSLSLKNLMRISKVLRQRRMDQGALELASSEVKFEMDTDKQTATDMALYTPYDTNSMVEEFMLLANVAVAEQIIKVFPSYSILRRHPDPKMQDLELLSEKLQNLGYQLHYQNSKVLSETLNNIQRPERYFNKIIRMMVTRCMNQAVYFNSSEYDPSEYKHYGLSMPIYTHFTSPIRRYADVLVHRLLAATIDWESLPHSLTDRRKMSKICQRMNYRNRMAQFASRTSANLHSYLVFRQKTDIQIEEAVITDFLPGGVIVIVPKLGLEGDVPMQLSQINPVEYSFGTSQRLKLYDTIRVKISISFENFRKKIEISYVE